MNVYMITNQINGKKYIGITNKTNIKERLNEHIKCSKMSSKYIFSLQYAIKKYGSYNFIITHLRSCKNRQYASLFETAYIKKYNSYKNGYNETYGGDGGSASIIKYSGKFINNVLTDLVNGFSVNEISNKYKIPKHTIYDFSRFRFAKSISLNDNLVIKLKQYNYKKSKKGKKVIVNIINDYVNDLTLLDLSKKYSMNENSIWNIINRNSYNDFKISKNLELKLIKKINSKIKKRIQQTIKDNDVVCIFNLFSTGKYTRKMLCKKMNIHSLDTITNILLRKTYTNVEIPYNIEKQCKKYIHNNYYYNKVYKKNILRENTLSKLIEMKLDNVSNKIIASELGLSSPFISEILSNKKWGNVPIDEKILNEFHKKYPQYLKERSQ